MRPQRAFLIDRQLKHEVARKSCEVSLDLFIESFGRHATVSPSRLAINRKMFRGGAEMDRLCAALSVGIGVLVNQGGAGWRWRV